MLAPAACGPDIDIAKSLTITDVISGYYDNGLKDGWNHLMPSLTFRIANSASSSLTGLELTVAYWQEGADGEMDSVLVQRIGNDTIPANGTSDPVTVRGTVGYTLEDVRDEPLHQFSFPGRHGQDLRAPRRPHLSHRQREAGSPDPPAREVRPPVKDPSRERAGRVHGSSNAGAAARPVRRGHDRHLQRRRRRHLLHPAMVAGLVPSGWAMLSVWLVGGVLAFAGAMAYAELAALRPHAGGEYVYLRAAFGPLAAFLTGWTSFVAGFSGAIAASAVGFAGYLGRFVPAPPTTRRSRPCRCRTCPLTVTPPESSSRLRRSSLLSLVHVRGSAPAASCRTSSPALKVPAIMTFVALGLVDRRTGRWRNLESPPRDRSRGCCSRSCR